jgi:hypothetical protein
LIYDITFRKTAFFCHWCENKSQLEIYMTINFICLIIDQCINTVQIVLYFRNNSTLVANCLSFSLHKKYFLYSLSSRKILLYHSISRTGDVTSTAPKMATWVAETCRWSPCNKITFINQSTCVGLCNKFTLTFLLILHFRNINITLKHLVCYIIRKLCPC